MCIYLILYGNRKNIQPVVYGQRVLLLELFNIYMNILCAQATSCDMSGVVNSTFTCHINCLFCNKRPAAAMQRAFIFVQSSPDVRGQSDTRAFCYSSSGTPSSTLHRIPRTQHCFFHNCYKYRYLLGTGLI